LPIVGKSIDIYWHSTISCRCDTPVNQ